MKKLLKKMIPACFQYLRMAIPDYRYDMKLFYRHSATMNRQSPAKLEGRIVMAYHIIEKGLTMPETRFGFGKGKLLELITLCSAYIDKYGLQNAQLIHGVEVVMEYEKFHQKSAYELDGSVTKAIETLKTKAKDIAPSEQKELTSKEYFSSTGQSFPAFARSRLSVRNYSASDLSVETIKTAVDLARTTPSACNRQTARVYVFTEKNQIDKILELQGGNRGFGHLANKLIVITAELGVFADSSERYQAWIDGGMFAMNLLYALHSQEVAACILNCSHTAKKDKKMRNVCPVKESEVYIAMISCGYAPESFKVALSPRKPLDEYLTIN